MRLSMSILWSFTSAQSLEAAKQKGGGGKKEERGEKRAAAKSELKE